MQKDASPAAARLKVGVVGVNDRIRRSILNGIVESPATTLVAVCSRDAVKALRTAAEHRCHATTSLEELCSIGDVDAVFIATPPEFHCEMSLAAIAAGKHVICEKPLALTAGETERMVSAAKAAKVRTAVNFTYRSGQHHRHVASLVEQGVLGSILGFRVSYWQARGLLPSTPWRDGLADLGPHLIDSVLWWLSLAGAGDVEAVCANRAGTDHRTGSPAASTWHCLVETAAGVSGVMEVGRTVPGYANGLQAEIWGSRSTLRMAFDAAGGGVELGTLGDGRPEGTFTALPTPPDFAVSYEEFPRRHMTRLAEGILGRIEFPGFEQGRRVQQVIDAAARSADERAWVRVAG
jgi:predicted dehydrogenase